jgi:hypothetical protein
VPLIRIRAAEPGAGFSVHFTFTDGTERTIDLRPYLRGVVFDPLLRDPNLFRAVRVDPALGTIVWPNGADLDPDVLYGAAQPAWVTDDDSRLTTAPLD